MSGQFQVEPDELVAHASHLDGLIDRLNKAVQAADYAMSDHAYGLLCAFLPPIINPTGEKAKESVSAAIEGVRATADNVRTAAKAYQEGDESEAQPFKKQASAESDLHRGGDGLGSARQSPLAGSEPTLRRGSAEDGSVPAGRDEAGEPTLRSGSPDDGSVPAGRDEAGEPTLRRGSADSVPASQDPVDGERTLRRGDPEGEDRTLQRSGPDGGEQTLRRGDAGGEDRTLHRDAEDRTLQRFGPDSGEPTLRRGSAEDGSVPAGRDAAGEPTLQRGVAAEAPMAARQASVEPMLQRGEAAEGLVAAHRDPVVEGRQVGGAERVLHRVEPDSGMAAAHQAPLAETALRRVEPITPDEAEQTASSRFGSGSGTVAAHREAVQDDGSVPADRDPVEQRRVSRPADFRIVNRTPQE